MMKPRLIDANALMKYTQNQISKTIDCNHIARFPTAYDPNKVVEQLEERRSNIRYDLKQKAIIQLCIEIVKKGGA